MRYRVFIRSWWKVNKTGNWPNNLEPHCGRKSTLRWANSEAEARAIAQQYNATHNPGRLSRKAEFEGC